MALFNFGKKKEEKKARCCPAAAEKQCKNENECRIKMFGAGCKSCHEMYENAMDAAGVYGLREEVAYVTDMPKVTGYGVMKLPALVIDEKVVFQDKEDRFYMRAQLLPQSDCRSAGETSARR